MLNRLHRWLRRRLPESRFERDLRDELRAHIEHRTDDLIRSGIEPAEARRRANVEFGGVEGYKEQLRDERSAWLRALPESLWLETRFATRRLVATPVFSIFAVLSLGLGLGVTTSVYSLVHSVLWKPIPLAEPSRTVIVATPSRANPARLNWRAIASVEDVEEISRTQTVLSSLAASAWFFETLATDHAAEDVLGEAVTGDYFPTIGISAVAGRLLQTSDDHSDAPSVVVVNQQVAEKWFDRPESVVGQVVRIGGRPFEVVGVAPKTFDGLSGESGLWTAFWIPQAHRPATTRAAIRSPRQFGVFGRLKPGRVVAEANGEIASLAARLDLSDPRRIPEGRPGAGTQEQRAWQARAAQEVLAASSGPPTEFGLLMLLLISMVLVVACTNLASLMLARGAMRSHEFAVRTSLGATRGRLVRELLVESLGIGVVGGLVALVVTKALLVVFTIDIPTNRGDVLRLSPHLNLPVLAASAGLLFGSLLVFGLGPALRLTRRTGIGVQAGTSIGLGPERRPWPLIRWQIAIAVCLLLVSSVTIRLVWDASRHDSGIDLDQLVVATVSFRSGRGQDEATARRLIDDVLSSAGRQPAIAIVAATTGMPFGQTRTPTVSLTPEEQPFLDGASYPSARALISTPEVFDTLGLFVLKGRPFDLRDSAVAPPVVVMSEFAAREVFGTTSAVGRRLAIRQYAAGGSAPTATAEVIGITRDTDVQSLTRRKSGLVLRPLAQAYFPEVSFFARATDDRNAAIGALTTAIRQTDPDLGLQSYGIARRVMAPGFVILRLLATLTGALGLLALALSLVGLYGVLSQSVTVRTREMGLRLALGATAGQVGRMALGQGIRSVAAGLVAGLAFGTLVRTSIRVLLEPVPIVDWFAMALVPIPILVAAAIACYLPARRAARVDPNVALRDL